MKLKSILLSMLAVAALAGCSKDDKTGGEIPNPGDIDRAYLSVTITTPKSDATKGGVTDGAVGDPAESIITELLVVGFAEATGGKQLGSYPVTIIPAQGVATAAFAVDGKIRSIFVIANPTTAVKAIVAATTSYEGVPLYALEAVEAEAGDTRHFLMTSGAQNTASVDDVTADKGLTAVTPEQVTDEVTEEIAKAQAVTDAATIYLDRIVAKVGLNAWTHNKATATANAPGAAHASLTGWLVNTMNKSSALYSTYVAATVSVVTPPAIPTITTGYRKDHNFNEAIPAGADKDHKIVKEFNHYGNDGNLHGATVPTWPTITDAKPFATPQYSTENTMDKVAAQNGQTTKLLIKAKYSPNKTLVDGAAIGADESYFMLTHPTGVVYYTLAQLQTYALTATVPNQEYLEVVAAAMGATTFAGLVVDNFDDTDPYAVAKATITAGASPVAFYFKSVCYYALNIKHDTTVDKFANYHYGVVRNNWYTITIGSILKPGTSYIPDPTDPDITDPTKPDPEDPNDPAEGFLSVKIKVNNWLTATQLSDLK